MKNIQPFQRCLAGFVLLVICISSATYAAKVDNIIEKVQKKYRKTKSIHIEFTESVRFTLTNTEVQSPAVLQMKGQDMFRLESEDQVLVNNGEVFWRFNKLDSQVLIDHAKKSDQDVMLNTFLYDFKDQYYAQLIDEENVGGEKTFSIKLTPRPDQQSIFISVKIWVSDKTWEIKRLIYEDYNSNETEYAIEKTTFNPDFQDSLFTFSPPEGIDVIDLRF